VAGRRTSRLLLQRVPEVEHTPEQHLRHARQLFLAQILL
jgi:hypothetical protein